MKASYCPGRPYLAGETVTAGSFSCTNCGRRHEIEKGKVTNLPVCQNCQNDTWEAAEGIFTRLGARREGSG
jgi:hypothetical protein